MRMEVRSGAYGLSGNRRLPSRASATARCGSCSASCPSRAMSCASSSDSTATSSRAIDETTLGRAGDRAAGPAPSEGAAARSAGATGESAFVRRTSRPTTTAPATATTAPSEASARRDIYAPSGAAVDVGRVRIIGILHRRLHGRPRPVGIVRPGPGAVVAAGVQARIEIILRDALGGLSGELSHHQLLVELPRRRVVREAGVRGAVRRVVVHLVEVEGAVLLSTDV